MDAKLDFITRRPIAHRGLHDGNNECWENTLTAFQRAIDRNFSIELDVTLSKDGLAMVFHDKDLKRLLGAEGYVHDTPSNHLQKMPVGGTEDFVPTLSTALKLIDGRVPVIIELKGVEKLGAKLVEAVADDLKDYNGEAAVMSFDHWLVREFKTIAPNVPRGLTAEGLVSNAMEAHFSMLAHDMQFISYSVKQVDNLFVHFCRDKLSMPIITWTVENESDVAATKKYAHQMTFEGFMPE